MVWKVNFRICTICNNNNQKKNYSFRKQWPINYYGKWMENVWTLPWYPSFACGSGYILTNDLIKWLAINHDTLYAYQGEDVSMGIWMTAINPNKIEVKYLYSGMSV